MEREVAMVVVVGGEREGGGSGFCCRFLFGFLACGLVSDGV